MAQSEPVALLNIFEVQEGDRVRHVIGFQDAMLAGARGLTSHAMVGEYTPGANGEFDPATFRVNQEFIVAFVAYMNKRAQESDEFVESALQRPGEPLYVIDPRFSGQADDEPVSADILGWYAVDAAGAVVPNSFTYNSQHAWFSMGSGASGVFHDRNFYAALHPAYKAGAVQIFHHGDPET